MATINGVDFDDVARDALAAAKAVFTENWNELRDIAENITKGLVNDAEFFAQKKATGEFNERDAKVWLEDQKIIARIRLRSLAIVSAQMAEDIWNAMAKVFDAAINKALGWNIL
jgi:hypothetical protein